MSKTTENKLREFRKKFGYYRGLRPDGLNQLEIESFFESAIKEATEEERERIIEFVQENRKGTFTDDGGNDCWYIDDLVKALKELSQQKDE